MLCAAGDAHGRLDRMYGKIATFEAVLGTEFAWVLHVGDFGIWPDPARVDRATQRHGGAGDFPHWWAERRRAPTPTLFIKGNHEDFVWLEERPDTEILENLFYLRNGERFVVRDGEQEIVVGGIGGCYGPSDIDRPSDALEGRAKRHYTRDEIERLAAGGPVDVLLLHDAPKGVPLGGRASHLVRLAPGGDPGASPGSDAAGGRRARGKQRRCKARQVRAGGAPAERRPTHDGADPPGRLGEGEGLDELIRRVRPKVCFFGHHHVQVETSVGGVPCIGLNIVPSPGCLVAFEVFSRNGEDLRVLGVWPRSPQG